jgi:hypothetical protein
MAQSASVAKLTPRHENIIAFLVANPTMRKQDVARAFGVTPAWLSTVIHSDAFQAKLAERQAQFFSAATQTIREKLETVAHLSLDKLIEHAEFEIETKEIRANAEMALERLGYGAQGPRGIPFFQQNTQNNFLVADSATLAAARERILARGNSRAGEPAESLPAPTATEIQSGGDS